MPELFNQRKRPPRYPYITSYFLGQIAVAFTVSIVLLEERKRPERIQNMGMAARISIDK
jgi:hypothetical protein